MQAFFNIHKSINVIHHINKLKDKNHKIISIHAQKAFDKIQHQFMIKTLQKAGIERTYLNIIKAIWQTHSKYYPQWWKIESIFPKVRNKTRVPTLTTTIQHNFVSFSHSNQRRKRNKRNPDWKEKVKLPLFADDMILYIQFSSVAQSCPTLSDPMDCSLPGSSLHGIF